MGESNDFKLTEKYSNVMSSEADLKEQLGKTVDTYVKYIDVDTGATDKKINEEVDVLLRKLDEFEQLLILSQSDANVCLFKHVPGLQTKFAEMQSVFEKVDRLEFMVARVKNDMDKVERQLSEAEASVESTTAGGTALKSINKIIFNPRSLMDNNSPTTTLPEFEPVNLFSTEEFFKEDSILKPAKQT